MRTVYTCLLLLSTWFCTAFALTAPVLQVDRAGPVVLTNGTVDFPFGATLPITTPFVLTYNLRNTGSMPLALHTPVLSGVLGATVAITTQPAKVVAPLGSTTIVFTVTGAPSSVSFKVSIGSTDLNANPFAWTVKTGPAQPEINVSYDQADLPNGFYNSGNPLQVGQADPVGAPPVSLYTFVVRNTGVAPLTITAITPTATQCTATRLAPGVLPVNVAPGGQLSIVYNIVSDGLSLVWYCDFLIKSNDSDEANFTFRLSGGFDASYTTGGVDGDGEVRVSSPTNPFTILKNDGVCKTTPGSSQAGVASSYSIPIWNMHVLGELHIYYPLLSRTLGVPTWGDAVTIVPQGPLSAGPLNVDLTGLPLAEKTRVTGQPPGVPPGTVDNVTQGYAIVAPWPLPFPPLTTPVTVQVTPLKAGPWSVPLTFQCNDKDGEGTYTFTLSGNALGVPDTTVSNRGTTLVTSGTTSSTILSAVGFTNSHAFVVRNTGNGTLLLADTLITSSLTNCTVVGVPTISATSVAPGGTATYTVRTTPTVGGAWSATFDITSSDPTPSPFQVTVGGTTSAPVPEIDLYNAAAAVPNGGTTAVKTSLKGKPTPYSIAVQNSGTGLLTVSAASTGAVTNCTASISSATAFTVAAVDPPGSVPLVITVTATAEGPWSVVVNVTSDDADEGSYSFTLTGTAVKLKKQNDCGIGTGFSLLLLMLVGAVLPLIRRRR